ncbi:MAG: DUF1559 domain-containing protein, partial [Thermomicrobiales bacterium]
MRHARLVHRPAFTLTELLIVIAILAVLAGLLLPAVQKVRENAARAQCANNLKQIAQGFQKHHAQFGAFPHGGTNDVGVSHAQPDNRAQWSWCYQILPFIEQETLYRNPTVGTLDSTPVKIFYCPSRRHAVLYNGKNKVDYAGNAGTFPDGANGIVTRPPGCRACRIPDILDGTSLTVMIGEKQLNSAMFGQSADDNEACFRPGWNDDWEVYRTGNSPPARDYGMPDSVSP